MTLICEAMDFIGPSTARLACMMPPEVREMSCRRSLWSTVVICRTLDSTPGHRGRGHERLGTGRSSFDVPDASRIALFRVLGPSSTGDLGVILEN